MGRSRGTSTRKPEAVARRALHQSQRPKAKSRCKDAEKTLGREIGAWQSKVTKFEADDEEPDAESLIPPGNCLKCGGVGVYKVFICDHCNGGGSDERKCGAEVGGGGSTSWT